MAALAPPVDSCEVLLPSPRLMPRHARRSATARPRRSATKRGRASRPNILDAARAFYFLNGNNPDYYTDTGALEDHQIHQSHVDTDEHATDADFPMKPDEKSAAELNEMFHEDFISLVIHMSSLAYAAKSSALRERFVNSWMNVCDKSGRLDKDSAEALIELHFEVSPSKLAMDTLWYAAGTGRVTSPDLHKPYQFLRAVRELGAKYAVETRYHAFLDNMIRTVQRNLFMRHSYAIHMAKRSVPLRTLASSLSQCAGVNITTRLCRRFLRDVGYEGYLVQRRGAGRKAAVRVRRYCYEDVLLLCCQVFRGEELLANDRHDACIPHTDDGDVTEERGANFWTVPDHVK